MQTGPEILLRERLRSARATIPAFGKPRAIVPTADAHRRDSARTVRRILRGKTRLARRPTVRRGLEAALRAAAMLPRTPTATAPMSLRSGIRVARRAIIAVMPR